MKNAIAITRIASVSGRVRSATTLPSVIIIARRKLLSMSGPSTILRMPYFAVNPLAASFTRLECEYTVSALPPAAPARAGPPH